MPNLPPNPAISSTAGDFIKDALMEIGVLAQGEELSSEDAAFCMRKLNRLLDTFNARQLCIFNVNFNTYALTPSHQPHTIGPGGDFDVPVRPTKIVAVNLVLTGTPNVNLPLGVRDDQWWAQNRVQGLTSTLPTDVYYSDEFPLGKLYFWPVMTAANSVQLETWSPFAAVTNLTDPVAYPSGYWDAIVYTLAVTLAPAYQAPISPIVMAAQQKAMSIVQGLNTASPRIDLRGVGGKGKGHFNFRTGGLDV